MTSTICGRGPLNDLEALRALEQRALAAEAQVARLEAWVETLSDRAQTSLKQLLDSDPLTMNGRKAIKLEVQYDALVGGPRRAG